MGVYASAIAILFLFVVMMLNIYDEFLAPSFVFFLFMRLFLGLYFNLGFSLLEFLNV
jgi:NADH:ubiquinone oxidoreductase subunit 6 (subunit J)